MSYFKITLSKEQVDSIAKALNIITESVVDLGNALNNVGYRSTESLVSEFNELLVSRNQKAIFNDKQENTNQFVNGYRLGKTISSFLIGVYKQNEPKKWWQETDFLLRLKKAKQI